MTQAEEDWADDNNSRAIKHIIAGVKYLIVANNNLQSIAFNAKPKRRKA